jgi:hypothetical protein
MIQDGNRFPIFTVPPPESPEWFRRWMREYLVPLMLELRFVHNEFEGETIVSGAIYPFTLTWKNPAPNTNYIVLLTPDGGDATTALTITAKTTTSITVAKVGTAPGNVYVLRVL